MGVSARSPRPRKSLGPTEVSEVQSFLCWTQSGVERYFPKGVKMFKHFITTCLLFVYSSLQCWESNPGPYAHWVHALWQATLPVPNYILMQLMSVIKV
jgi:hypothetical protein